jgi:hypothetical protein
MVVTATSLVMLAHAVIDLWLHDPVAVAHGRNIVLSEARWEIAKLVVSAPLFAWMTILTERAMAGGTIARTSPIRKWSIYLALFISGLVLLGDATYMIHSLLMGETTLSFTLKAGVVAAVAAAVFVFYLREVNGDTDAA